MPLYDLHERPAFDAPTLIAAFDGWVDAGKAGTGAAEHLAEGARVVATFDADRLFDYRARRPTLDIVDGRLTGLEWPALELRAASVEGRDLIVLAGPEPDYRWRALAGDVVKLAKELGVASWVSLGAVPVAAPHTRPLRVLATASAPGLLPAGVTQGPDGRLRVPSAALSVLEMTASRAGIPSVGFFAQVPHYVSAAYPGAAIELLRHVGMYLGIDPPLGGLPGKALETRSLLDAAAAADESTRAYIQRLEELADEARLPAGDDLIADIERFLRERGGGSGGAPTGGDERPN